MKKIILLLIFTYFNIYSQEFNLLSWNISNLGKSKTQNDIIFISETIKKADIICIQEIVVGSAGAKKISDIVFLLNSDGNKWDYIISDPTESTGNRAERYAFIWNSRKFKIKRRFELDKVFKDVIEREPFIGSFAVNDYEFKIFNFHALPKKHNPEKEIKYFKQYNAIYGSNLIFLGDFNSTTSNSVFTPLYKMGYLSALNGQKTTLKQECKQGECLANSYDHFFYKNSEFELLKSEAILFYKNFETMKLARKISDHIPIMIRIKIKKTEN